MTHTSVNVDPTEIRKFEELASRWWDKQGEFKPLHEMNPLRLNFINSGTPLEGTKVCDVGCGGGILSESLAKCGATTTGLDMGKAPLSVARLHAMESELDIDYQQVTAEDFARQNPGKYDVVTCMEMLEHVPDLADFITKLKSLLKPNGILIIAVPNFKSEDAKHYESFWAAYDVPRHLWHFSRTSIESIFADFNMKILEVLPMVFDSFYVSLLSEKYRKGKSNYFSAFYQGFRSNRRAKQSGEYSSLIYLIK